MNSANIQAILVAQEYRQRIDSEIALWMGYDFEQSSYAKWSIDELLKLLKEHNNTPPLIILESFLDKIRNFEKLNAKNKSIFSIAYDTVRNIADSLSK